MKLLKKLLPVAAIASTAAIVAPIVTSCGAGTTLDGTSLYVPKTAQAVMEKKYEETGYTNELATKLYFNDVNNNPDVFKEDMLYSISDMLLTARGTLAYEYWVDLELKAVANYKNIKVDTVKNTLSFEVSGSLKSNLGLFSDAKKIGKTSGGIWDSVINIDSFNLVVTNVPYDVTCYDVETPSLGIYTWTVAIALDDTAETTGTAKGKIKGSVSVPGQGIMVFNNEEINLKSETKPTPKESIAMSLFEHLARCNQSYHMYYIKNASLLK